MEVDVKALSPGMVTTEAVLGKSGRAIVAKNTPLTDVEIEFLKKFLVQKVSVTASEKQARAAETTQNEERLLFPQQGKSLFVDNYAAVVVQYKKMFATWLNNLPVNMYDIRKNFLPLFEQVQEVSFTDIVTLLQHRRDDLFFYKSVAMSLLAISLAQQLGYERKEWLQIGFAALLSDCGLAKSKPLAIDQEAIKRHPISSLEMIKNETTLTKLAKIAIVQHHERLDGSGYPMKIKGEQIHPFARIIAVADDYYTLVISGEREIERKLAMKSGNELDEEIVQLLLEMINEKI